MNCSSSEGNPWPKFSGFAYFGLLFPMRGLTGAHRSSFWRYLLLKFRIFSWTLKNFSTFWYQKCYLCVVECMVCLMRQERLHSIKKYKQNTIIKKVCQCGSVTTTHTHTHSAHIHRLCLFISEMLSMCGMHAVMLNELCHRKEIIIQQHKKTTKR